MKKIVRFSLIFSLLIGLSACTSLRVKAPVAYGSRSDIQKIALVTTLVGPIQQPETPIGDASTFNKKTDALAEELNALLQKKADQFYQTLGKGLGTALNAEVRYGEGLKESERYDRALRDAVTENLILKGAGKFKTFYVGEGGFNVLPFDNGEVVNFLETSSRLRSIVRGLTRDLETEAVAFSYHYLDIDRVQAYGAGAKVKLVSHIFLYNDRGVVIGQGYGETEAVKITGDNLEEYRAVLDQYPGLQNMILTEMTKAEEAS